MSPNHPEQHRHYTNCFLWILALLSTPSSAWDEVKQLSVRCNENNLDLNIPKMIELIYRRTKRDIQLLVIGWGCLKRVSLFHFLAIYIESNLSRGANTAELL